MRRLIKTMNLRSLRFVCCRTSTSASEAAIWREPGEDSALDVNNCTDARYVCGCKITWRHNPSGMGIAVLEGVMWKKLFREVLVTRARKEER